MRHVTPLLIFLGALLLAFPEQVAAINVDVTLRGSPNSMIRQNEVAKGLGYTFVETAADVEDFVERGDLIPIPGNEHYVVDDGVSYPVARPEIRLFIERLAKQYREGTGEKLVVTSLTRPSTEQPRNSHDLSVHPAGIAIDFRVSSSAASRAWLENVLLRLERQGLLDVTRERYPPHYHVALFPEAYRAYVEDLIGADAVAEAMLFREPEPVKAEPVLVHSLPARTAASAVAPTGEDPDRLTLFTGISAAALLLFLLGMRTVSRRENAAA